MSGLRGASWAGVLRAQHLRDWVVVRSLQQNASLPREGITQILPQAPENPLWGCAVLTAAQGSKPGGVTADLGCGSCVSGPNLKT